MLWLTFRPLMQEGVQSSEFQVKIIQLEFLEHVNAMRLKERALPGFIYFAEIFQNL